MDVSLTIDGKVFNIPEGSTLLEASHAAGIKIPTICYHEATTSNALCRLCVVEIDGLRLLQPACVVKVAQDMQVHTKSDRVIRARRTILEMLVSSTDLTDSPEIMDLIREYGASENRFPEAEKRSQPVLDDNPMYIREYSKCILCWRCVQVCADDAQFTNALSFGERGYRTHIATFFNDPMPATTCVFCGQCIGVCPTGAIKPKREFLLESGLTANQISEQLASSKNVNYSRRKNKKDDGS